MRGLPDGGPLDGVAISTRPGAALVGLGDGNS